MLYFWTVGLLPFDWYGMQWCNVWQAYTIVALLVSYVIPVMVFAYCYGHIFHTIRRQSKVVAGHVGRGRDIPMATVSRDRDPGDVQQQATGAGATGAGSVSYRWCLTSPSPNLRDRGPRPRQSPTFWPPGARFTKYLTIVLWLSYDNAKVTIDLRRTYNLQNISRRTHGFAFVQITCKIVRSSEIGA